MATNDKQSVAHIKQGVKEQSVSDLIKTLHHQGLTITQSIKVLMSTYQISLREAKSLISNHPVWNSVTKIADTLHQEMVQTLENATQKHSAVFRSQLPVEKTFRSLSKLVKL